MALSTTPIPPTRAESTASGACTSGSTAPPGDATRRASGGAATTITRAERGRGGRGATSGAGDVTTHGFPSRLPAGVSRRLRPPLRRECRGHDRLVRVHVDDGRDGDAR